MTGILYLTLYLLIAALQTIFLSLFLQSWPMAALMSVTFSITAGFFFILQIPHLKSFFGRLRASWRTVLGCNIYTALAWISFFMSLKDLEPAVADAVAFAIGPAITALFWRQLRPSDPVLGLEAIAAFGIVVGVAGLIGISFMGSSGVGAIAFEPLVVGMIAALVSGVTIVCTTIYSKRMSDQGFTAAEIMASRFTLLLVWGYSTWFFGETIPADAGTFPWHILIVAVFGVLLPVFFLQKGVELSAPITVALMLSTLPALTFALQMIDQRLQFSWASLLCILLCVIFSAMGVNARLRSKKTA